MGIDLRPIATDMTLCLNTMCMNKCKRYYQLWQPNQYSQSYIYPSINYDENGIQKKCKCRLERTDE